MATESRILVTINTPNGQIKEHMTSEEFSRLKQDKEAFRNFLQKHQVMRKDTSEEVRGRERSIESRKRSVESGERSVEPGERDRSLEPREREISVRPRERSDEYRERERYKEARERERSVDDPRERYREPRESERSVDDPRERYGEPRERKRFLEHRETERYREPRERERSVEPRQRSVEPRERSVEPRERSVEPRERSVEPRERSVEPRERSVEPGERSDDLGERSWGRPASLLLIGEYSKLSKNVEAGRMTKKTMWSLISRRLCEKGYHYTSDQVSGRWKSLLRGYKNTKDNNRRSGNGRKSFEYESQLDEVFPNDPSITPEITLSSTCTTACDDDDKDNAPAPKKVRRKTGDVAATVQNFICEQEKYRKEESERRERMHKEKMDTLRSLIDVFTNNQKKQDKSD